MAEVHSISPWLELRLPATHLALGPVQTLVLGQAQALGFSHAVQQRMRAACDEALSTALHLSHDAGADADNVLQMQLGVEEGALVLRLSDNGLPYDTSLLPEYNPRQPEQAGDDAAGLAAFLMQKLADRFQVLNLGQQGHHVQLEWRLPDAAEEAAEVPAASAPAGGQPAQSAPDPTRIRPLQASDAIHLARLMYRSYGYSYVNPDMYIAERIQARVGDGRLTSWVAESALGEGPQAPVGHIAFMKAHRDDDTLEVGAAVVAPQQRGGGLLGQLLSAATEALTQRPERAAFVHAVTAHPFTQKTFGRLGYLPTALLVAYTPASLQFRSISGRPTGERGSVYYACKLLRPAAEQAVYLPAALQPLVLPRAQDIGLPLVPMPAPEEPLTGETQLEVYVEDALNAAFLTLRHAGADFALTLRRTLRRLCRAQVDVIYLSLDMGQPGTAQACEQSQSQGFLVAGLTPFMPWPATLCLQYLNNQELHEEKVCAVGPAAEALRSAVFTAYRAQEFLDEPAA
jgi:anti-sigma regulatory factor (Ser/Thr protein kinase)/predicted N-acetyltransferase YhbS